MDKNNLLSAMIEKKEVEIIPCESTFIDKTEYKKMDLTSSQKSQISAMFSQIPMVLATEDLAQAYVVCFPEGLPHTLMTYKNGLKSSIIMGDTGIVGHAGFQKLSTEAALMRTFSAMSLITGQYFMAEITQNLSIINQKIDHIIDFLYGDKKAELISEISFIRYANQNYSYIMLNDAQKIATISNIQSARIVAIQDIEFYLYDLLTKAGSINKSRSDFESTVNEALKIKDCLELAMQLYVSSSLMEVYYSQNYDSAYLISLKNEMTEYINKYEKNLLSVFSILKGHTPTFQKRALKRPDIETLTSKIDQVTEKLNDGKKSFVHDMVEATFSNFTTEDRFILSREGVYIKSTF